MRGRSRGDRRLIAALSMLITVVVGRGMAAEPEAVARGRRPAALVLADGGRLLLAANARSGSISVIDTTSRRLVAEHDVGKGLADLAPLPDGTHLLAVDAAANAVLLLERHGVSLRVVSRVEVSPDPISVVITRDGASAVASSRWSRRLTVLAMAGPPSPGLKAVRTIELPFGPRAMIELPGDGGLLVADAFGGKLALVDVAAGRVQSVRSLPAHNIRGLALAPDGRALAIAHQTLNPLARTTFDDVHWGLLVNNHVRVLALDAILKAQGDLLEGGRLIDLGDVGRGAGDPSAIVPDAGGNLVVALAGVGELGIVPKTGRPRRVAVGRHPTALAAAPGGKTVYVADGFDDTISVVDVEGGRRVATIPPGPRPEETLAERGERLFHDARLSHDGWMSCQSCHTDGHTSGLSSDTLGDGSYGAAKRIPALLGVAATGPWTWTGSIARLEDQVRRSIETTMQGPKDAASGENVKALTAYLRTLAPLSPSLTASRAAGDDDTASRGREVFRARKCDACHAPPDYTTADRFDVGLADEVGNRAFNPPSLLGVSRREPLLHDGRAATLEDLFTRYRHPRETTLDQSEVADLVAFLRTL